VFHHLMDFTFFQVLKEIDFLQEGGIDN